MLLGAPPDVVPYACKYLRFILLASPFMMSALTLNNQLRLQGNARFGMIGIVSGALLNIALDPLFIFVLRLGVTGASLATAVSQLLSGIGCVVFMIRRFPVLRLKKEDRAFDPALARRILEYREGNGPFRRLTELMDVEGIGSAVFEGLQGWITLD